MGEEIEPFVLNAIVGSLLISSKSLRAFLYFNSDCDVRYLCQAVFLSVKFSISVADKFQEILA